MCYFENDGGGAAYPDAPGVWLRIKSLVVGLGLWSFFKTGNNTWQFLQLSGLMNFVFFRNNKK